MFRRAVHPGEILKDELAEFGVTPTEFARQIDVPANRVSQIIAEKRSVTGDSALRFGHWLGVDPQFWLNLQSQFDLAVAERDWGDDNCSICDLNLGADHSRFAQGGLRDQVVVSRSRLPLSDRFYFARIIYDTTVGQSMLKIRICNPPCPICVQRTKPLHSVRVDLI